MAPNDGRVGNESQLDNNEEIMKAVKRAMDNFGFCPNRIGAVAGSLGKIQDLPDLFPTDDSELEQRLNTRETRETTKTMKKADTLDALSISANNHKSTLHRRDSAMNHLPVNSLHDAMLSKICFQEIY